MVCVRGVMRVVCVCVGSDEGGVCPRSYKSGLANLQMGWLRSEAV